MYLWPCIVYARSIIYLFNIILFKFQINTKYFTNQESLTIHLKLTSSHDVKPSTIFSKHQFPNRGLDSLLYYTKNNNSAICETYRILRKFNINCFPVSQITSDPYFLVFPRSRNKKFDDTILPMLTYGVRLKYYKIANIMNKISI